MNFEIDKLDWKKTEGLIPTVVQDHETRQVLILAYMNRAALEKTLESGQVTFFSRSKQRLWTKGETSGNFLKLESVTADCDGDSLLILARPQGPACHRNTTSCFGEETAPGLGFLAQLVSIIDKRYQEPESGSYTSKLFREGVDRMAQKVGEEGVEVVIAAKNENSELLAGEAADLLFHLFVLLRAKSVSFSSVVDVLRSRHAAKMGKQ